MRRVFLFSALLFLARSQSPPPLGPLQQFAPIADQSLGYRHCSFQASFCPTEPDNEDFQFILVAGLTGAPSTFSIQSLNFPDHYVGLFNKTSGLCGVLTTGDAPLDDLTWSLVAPLVPPPAGLSGVVSLMSLTKAPAWAGKYLTLGATNNAACHYSAPSGDAVLAPPSGARSTFHLGFAGPKPPATIAVDGAAVVNAAVSPRIMGCHHDFGFAQAPRGFLANLIYGSSFEPGTQRVPGWTPFSVNTSNAPPVLTAYAAFSGKPSMSFSLDAGGGSLGLRNRGIGGAGLFLEGSKPYTVSLWVWSGGAPTAFVELVDFTTNTSLARQDFTVMSNGPDWGSVWYQYNFSLTPSAGTPCVGIPFDSDPTIDCGGDAGPAHVCVRCGGELRVGISSEGNFKVGYVELLPGPWGLVADKRGNPIPVLKSAGDALTAMGVTLMRNGGSVSQSMRWKDWRGAVWARPSQQQIWGFSLLSGWGPFEYIEMGEALGIEPVITLAYDTNDADDFADLVEYCWGDAATTSWGRRRAADRGRPDVYNVTVFELGNEQYNPHFVEQVAAMEARSKQVGSPPLHYMFPENGGVDAADAAAILAAMPDVVPRILPDLHVGAGGAVGEARGLFANPPVHGFNQSAINAETNAGTHDLKRGLDEAADLIDWLNAETSVATRLYARTASFCSGTSNNFDSWDQGISFFLPNMTWYQPPGYVHIMVTNTWAETTLATAGAPFPFSAQRTADGKTLVLRAVNTYPGAWPFNAQLMGLAAAGPSATVWTLGGSGFMHTEDNTPSQPAKISPVQTTMPVPAGATNISFVMEENMFVVIKVALQ